MTTVHVKLLRAIDEARGSLRLIDRALVTGVKLKDVVDGATVAGSPDTAEHGPGDFPAPGDSGTPPGAGDPGTATPPAQPPVPATAAG